MYPIGAAPRSAQRWRAIADRAAICRIGSNIVATANFFECSACKTERCRAPVWPRIAVATDHCMGKLHCKAGGAIMFARTFGRGTRMTHAGVAAFALVAGGAGPVTAQALFESRQLTPAGEYTSGIEGPAVDATGVLYVVNFERKGTIGRLPVGAARSELFARLPEGSIGNGIRFDPEGRMYVADFKKHN